MNMEVSTLVENNNSGWTEWSRHVLAELIRLNDCYENLDKKIDNHLQNNESRLTAMETSLKNQKWAFGIVITATIAILLALLGLIIT